MVCVAIQGANTSNTIAMMPLLIQVVALANPIIRPALAGSLFLNSPRYFVVVMPMPKPATVPKRPTVLWIIPSSPKPCLPNMRPTRIADSSPSPREMSEPASDQKAPLASR